MHTQIYLFFDGRLEEALTFYKKTLGIEVEMQMRDAGIRASFAAFQRTQSATAAKVCAVASNNLR